MARYAVRFFADGTWTQWDFDTIEAAEKVYENQIAQDGVTAAAIVADGGAIIRQSETEE